MQPDVSNMPNHARLSWREAQRGFKMTKSRQRRTIGRLRARGVEITHKEFAERYAKGETIG